MLIVLFFFLLVSSANSNVFPLSEYRDTLSVLDLVPSTVQWSHLKEDGQWNLIVKRGEITSIVTGDKNGEKKSVPISNIPKEFKAAPLNNGYFIIVWKEETRLSERRNYGQIFNSKRDTDSEKFLITEKEYYYTPYLASSRDNFTIFYRTFFNTENKLLFGSATDKIRTTNLPIFTDLRKSLDPTALYLDEDVIVISAPNFLMMYNIISSNKTVLQIEGCDSYYQVIRRVSRNKIILVEGSKICTIFLNGTHLSQNATIALPNRAGALEIGVFYDGSFLLVYKNNFRIYAQLFDKETNPVGLEITISDQIDPDSCISVSTSENKARIIWTSITKLFYREIHFPTTSLQDLQLQIQELTLKMEGSYEFQKEKIIQLEIQTSYLKVALFSFMASYLLSICLAIWYTKKKERKTK